MPTSDVFTRGRHRLRHSLAAMGCAAALALAGSGLVAVVGATGAAAAPPPGGPAQPAPCPIQASANGRYVEWVYQQVLLRCADPSGLPYWTGKLDAGFSRLDFALALNYSSEEIVGNEIFRFYEEFLHQAPTGPEIGEWLAKIHAEGGTAQLVATVLSSDAYWNALNPGSTSRTSAFVNALYDNTLDRSGDQSTKDSAGFTYWVNQLGSTPTMAQRYNVALSFELSPENATFWVECAYTAGLQREPKPPEAAYWVNWLQTHAMRTFDLWSLVLASPEAYALAGVHQNPPPQGPPAQASTVQVPE